MKKVFKTTIIGLSMAMIGNVAIAQSAGSGSKQKEQEIVIRQNGEKTGKTTIVIDGEKVTINGKAIDEYKSGDVTVLRRNRVENLAPGANVLIPRGGVRSRQPFAMSRTSRAFLGVVTEKAEDGARITEVNSESAAAKAGLQKDDVITRVGETKIEDADDLVEAIGKLKPTDKVEIAYKRGNKQEKVNVTLGENKARTFAMGDNFNFDFDFPRPEIADGNIYFSRRPKLGLEIQDIEEGKGVEVKDVDGDSPADKAGLKEGDLITDVNGKSISSVDDVRGQVKDLKEGDNIKVTYKRGNNTQTAEVKIPKRLKTADL